MVTLRKMSIVLKWCASSYLSHIQMFMQNAKVLDVDIRELLVGTKDLHIFG